MEQPNDIKEIPLDDEKNEKVETAFKKLDQEFLYIFKLNVRINELEEQVQKKDAVVARNEKVEREKNDMKDFMEKAIKFKNAAVSALQEAEEKNEELKKTVEKLIKEKDAAVDERDEAKEERSKMKVRLRQAKKEKKNVELQNTALKILAGKAEMDNDSAVKAQTKEEKQTKMAEKEKKDLMTNLQEQVLCPVCLLVPRSGKMPMCRNGHTTCDKCRRYSDKSNKTIFVTEELILLNITFFFSKAFNTFKVKYVHSYNYSVI